MKKGSKIILFISLLLFSCNNNKKNKEHNFTKEYFDKNHWSYPFELNKQILLDSLHKRNIYKPNVDKIYSYIKEFANSDSVKNKLDEAIHVSEFNFDSINKGIFDCTLEYYRKGIMSGGIVLPLEDHGIIENRLYIVVGRVQFKIVNDSIYFLRWPYL